MPKSLICNASTLILLTRASVIDDLIKKKLIIIPEKVYEEAILEGKKKGTSDAFKLEKLVEEGRISKEEVSVSAKDKMEFLFNLKSGERDTVALAEQRDIRDVLTDDKRAINACKALKLRFATALDIVINLRRGGTISKAKAYKALDRLEEYGWYTKALIEQARRDIDAT